MPTSKAELWQRLQTLMFDNGTAQDWVQDVWCLSPMLGDTAAKTVDVLEAIAEVLTPEQLADILQRLEAPAEPGADNRKPMD